MSVVVWHDLECGGYDADLALWRALAREAGGPLLEIGAGTGRVALDLAARGHEVVALDADPVLLGELKRRAVERGLPVGVVSADARSFAIARRFSFVLVPMQTLQLLGGSPGRARFYARAREHLAPGGLLVAALADALEGFDEPAHAAEGGGSDDHAPSPDVREVDGTLYASRPVAVREGTSGVSIERIRETRDRAGTRTAEANAIWLDRVDAAGVAHEAAAHGFDVLPTRRVPATDEYVGSQVVVLRAA